jgi:hypothetical protein
MPSTTNAAGNSANSATAKRHGAITVIIMSTSTSFGAEAFRSGANRQQASGEGHWFRRGGNIIVLPIRPPTRRWEETEESVGDISGSDYTKWVQRSLNRLYGLNLPIDGVDTSPAYRAALRKFNLEYSGRDYPDIDEQTQNDLIYANEGHEGYVKWVIGRLINVGFGALRPSPTYTPEIREAIKAFQAKVGLRADGYVGSKTELALIKRTNVLPPGEPKNDPPPTVRKIKNVTVWFNAFIPKNLSDSWRHVPSFGPYKGKVFLHNPVEGSYYTTDQRLWSQDPKASARMHSRVDLLLSDEFFSAVRKKQMGLTVRVDRMGNVECRKRASTDEMTVSEVRQITSNHFRFSLTGEGRNPCTTFGAPPIDYELTVNLVFTSDRKSAKIRVVGAVDEFPAFEMYAAVNDDFDRVITLFRREASSDPSDIMGGAARSIDVTREIAPR